MPLDDEARRRAAATKRERTQRKIVDAVASVMEEAQYIGDVTYAAVSKRSGVSEATIYRYYPTIADLRRSVILETASRLADTDDVQQLMWSILFPVKFILTTDEIKEVTGAVRSLLAAKPESRELVGELVLDSFLNLDQLIEQRRPL